MIFKNRALNVCYICTFLITPTTYTAHAKTDMLRRQDQDCQRVTFDAIYFSAYGSSETHHGCKLVVKAPHTTHKGRQLVMNKSYQLIGTLFSYPLCRHLTKSPHQYLIKRFIVRSSRKVPRLRGCVLKCSYRLEICLRVGMNVVETSAKFQRDTETQEFKILRNRTRHLIAYWNIPSNGNMW